jgi:2-hydroxychromene-2-carboxylate isomerase
MTRVIDYWFDFVSPFAYLAWQKLPALAQRHDCDLRPHVTDLAALKLLAGNTGPSNRAIPNKTRYLQFDKKRWAARYRAPIVNPQSFDSARANRGFFYAEDKNRAADYLDACWRRIWGEGGDPTSDALLADVASALHWSASEFLAFTTSQTAQARYETATREAHEHKVFGVPTMIVAGEMYWGNDRLDFLEEHLIASANAEAK